MPTAQNLSHAQCRFGQTGFKEVMEVNTIFLQLASPLFCALVKSPCHPGLLVPTQPRSLLNSSERLSNDLGQFLWPIDKFICIWDMLDMTSYPHRHGAMYCVSELPAFRILHCPDKGGLTV